MRKIKGLIVIFFFVISAQVLAKPLILTSIYPVYLFVKDIAGDEVEVDYLLRPGVSPHAYELKISDMKKLKRADAFVFVGCGLERWLSENIYSGKPVFYLCSGRNNPHVWLSAVIIARKSKRLALFLSSLFPSKGSYFKKRADNLGKQLLSLLKLYRKAFNNKKMCVISHHNAWVYLLKDLEISYVGAIEKMPFHPPTPGWLKRLVEKAKGKRVIVINETGHNPKFALIVAKRVKGCMVEISPLGLGTEKNFVQFLEFVLMRLKRCAL